jgi:hypothetical protein
MTHRQASQQHQQGRKPARSTRHVGFSARAAGVNRGAYAVPHHCATLNANAFAPVSTSSMPMLSPAAWA